ncbi:conserved hypothetical protein [Sporisorium reilianum SRZ2]|uniref:FHA domain-containing protein n=1 Tax=Sporisorium reilianum (strain SRZ2) TaxID=999809 RepID=E6ZVX2_SPORE|nr:conserved hypothetical protein [Sporisorium reilianum SRZ2]
MLNSLRRSFGMSPSSSHIQADYVGNDGVPAGVLSPSNRPNTFVPLRRSNSFTNFFSSSRSSSPVKESFEQSSSNAIPSPAAKASSSSSPAQAESDAVLAYLVLLDKKKRQKERFPIQSLKTTMGRSLDNDVRFLVNDVSRHHCTIEIEIKQDHEDADSTQAFLQVLGANGVLLNGDHVFSAPRGAGRYELHTGDSILVAKRSFIFELAQPASAATASPNLFSSPVKGSAQSAALNTPATSNRRRVRMSLVNAAQINTPARPSNKPTSPAKTGDSQRESRRATGLERFLQTANVSPSKKTKARQSLTLSTSVANVFGTPASSRNALVEPKTAPPKQVSFSLYANSYTGRLSPVKQMRMMPPLDTMNEEHDGSFRSDTELPQQEAEMDDQQEDDADAPRDESEEDIVIVEEIEQEQEQPAQPEEPESQSDAEPTNGAAAAEADVENAENIPPATASSSSTPNGSPSKSGSPKRAKRRSSFFGHAGPFRGISLGFYAEERTEATEPVDEVQPEPEQLAQPAEEFSDASDAKVAPIEEEELAPEPVASPVARRVMSGSIRLGISKTPSPVKHQHFVGLTPLPRRPRLNLASRRKVSLRTQTLLRSSEAYADRLFLPPPPPTPSGAGPSGLSKSMSMPSDMSTMASAPPLPAFDGADDFESRLDPALSEEEVVDDGAEWKDAEDDEDEVDQSLSVLSPSPQKSTAYTFSPVKTASLPQFATPQPASRTHSRRISMPPAGAADAQPSMRSALVRLQISGAGERVVHEMRRQHPDAAVPLAEPSPSKARKVVRVSDVGLPASELSMGFDVVQDGAAAHESTTIADALNDLFTAEEDEMTDDEEELDEQEDIVQISAKAPESPVRPSTDVVAPLQIPRTPAALDSVRRLFSASAAAPATPDMRGLGTMLASPQKTPRYGALGDKMRANPDIVELLSPSKSPKKQGVLGAASPAKGRRGVRRSQAAEVAATPRAVESRTDAAVPAVTPLSTRAVERGPAFEAELHVTVFDAAAMDAQNEVLAQAVCESQGTVDEVEPVEEAASAVEEEALQVFAPEQELVAPQENEDLAPVAEVAPEAAAEVVEETATQPEAEAVPAPAVAETIVAKQPEAAVASATEPLAVEASPAKTRASRRNASSSPVKRTARSASPTKRALRSSPVKRAAAAIPAAEVFTAQQAAEEVIAQAEDEQQAEAVVETEASSPTKPARRTGGRKAKQAATEAICATLTAPQVAAASPEKPTRRGRAAAAKVEDEAVHVEHEEKEQEEDEAPKRATRSRATRSTAVAAKPARATRTRSAKAATETALPSSSAAYGDDEASDDEPAPSKRAAATRARTASASRSKTTARTANAAPSEADEVEESRSEKELEDEKEQEQVATSRATATRSTRAKAAPAAKAKGKAKAAAAEKDDASSSATTGTTTRSGRTTRRAAAAK